MANDNEKDGNQQGAVNRSASQQGDKTRARQAEIAQSGESEKKGQRGPNHDPADIREHNDAGKDRLFEDREQHDEAEKNSEKTRKSRDDDRHDHVAHGELEDRERQASAKRKS